jgi:hypothetical protein
LLAVLVLLARPAPGQDPQPKKKKDATRNRVATEQDYAYLGHLKEIVGRLVSLDTTTDGPEGAGRRMTLKVEYPTLELKPGASLQSARVQKQIWNMLRQQQQAQRQFQQILRNPNPVTQQQQLSNLMNRVFLQQAGAAAAAGNPRNNPFRTVVNSVTFELPVRDDVKVARAQPPVQYDDKGNVVELTKEQLKKMRDPNMPGFTAAVDDLQSGQLVKAYLAKPKAAKKKAADKKTAEPAPDAAGEKAKEAPPEQPRPEVRMVLILAEADASAQPPERPKRKKKDQ